MKVCWGVVVFVHDVACDTATLLKARDLRQTVFTGHKKEVGNGSGGDTVGGVEDRVLV